MNGNVSNVSWSSASFKKKLDACFWWNRTIKQISFGGGIAAFFQAAFTSLDSTVQKMDAILAMRTAKVDEQANEIQINNADEYKVAMSVLLNNQQTKQTDATTNDIAKKVQSLIDLAGDNTKLKQALISHLINKIDARKDVVDFKVNLFLKPLENAYKDLITKTTQDNVTYNRARAISLGLSGISKLPKMMFPDTIFKADDFVSESSKNKFTKKDLEGNQYDFMQNEYNLINSYNGKLSHREKIEYINKAKEKAVDLLGNFKRETWKFVTDDIILYDIADEFSNLLDADKQTLQQVRNAAKGTGESAEKTRAQQFLNLIVSELKEGREILEIKDCFGGNLKTEFGKELYEMYKKQPDQIQQLSQKKNLEEKSKIKQMLGKIVKDYCRSFDGNGTYVLSYDTTIDEEILYALKALDNADGHLKKRKNELNPDLILQQNQTNVTEPGLSIENEVSDLFYNLYVALEKKSYGSGGQLLFIPEQTARDSCLLLFVKQTVNSFDDYASTYFKNDEGALQRVDEDKNFKFYINLKMVDKKPYLTFGYDIQPHIRMRVDMDDVSISDVSGDSIAPVTNNFPMDVHLMYKLNAQSDGVEILPESKCYVANIKNCIQKANLNKRTLQDIIPDAKQQ